MTVALAEYVRAGSWTALVAAGLAAAAVLVLFGVPDGADGAGTSAAGRPCTSDAGRPDGSDTSCGPSTAAVGPVRRTPGRARRRTARRDSAHAGDAQVSSALALLALAYRSGLPTWGVLEAVATGLTGPASTDLRQVATALRWGATDAEAWASVGVAWAPAARAVAIAHQAGVPPSAMLLAASDDLHRAELDRLEISAARVGVRLVAPLGLVLLPAFCLTTVVPLVVALGRQLLVG